ncbi:MAG TPA: GMC family oxidoreductase N-terminal domain-containing protein [Vicinamibacterales bacterium]|nr:GMC family oxidoreductase N-terminal domain-containing protein [Vicinamibacterales bacterium]
MASEFDYIIVGSGASGAVIAHRLSEAAGVSVLLLEAGGTDTRDAIKDPGGLGQIWGSDVDWKFATEPQPAMADRSIMINQGKVLGGSTSLNAMMYVRGNPRNFDMWNAMGADGWSYKDVLPYFKKSENFEGGASEHHGTGGPLSVRVCPDDVMRSEHFQNGAVELGFDGPGWDYNGARQENGAGLLQFHIAADGTRANSAAAFLRPIADRKNLTIELGAEAEKLVFDGSRVVGVQYRQNGELKTARAGKEVVVSAGAFLSPKLLMLSGIGPAAHLESVGVPVVVDLPGVGQNLQDHVQVPVVFASKLNLPNTTLLTGNVLFAKMRDGMSAAPPDLQLNFTPSVPAPLQPVLPFKGCCIFLAILVQPFSIGEVTLRSANPADAPKINPRYLSAQADVDALVKAVKLARDITGTKAFSAANGGEVFPGPAADLTNHVRTQGATLWHPAGTCKMGQDAMAVVDPQLRVRGVQGLRVADASVMPTVPSGNTVAGCFMIGEKAADMMRHG